jgi:transglutaminase-like putative cysteine protease
MKPKKPSGWALAASGLTLALKVGFWILVVLLPIAGAWIGSSLAAYGNGPVWVPIVVAVLAFPVLPLGWDALSGWLRARRAKKRAAKKGSLPPPPRFLTFGDRLVLRTMAVNLVFVGVLLLWFPDRVFTALATRGDWFLEGTTSEWAQGMRRRLFAAAEKLEWMWKATHDNPFDDKGGGDVPPPPPPPSKDDLPPAPSSSARPDKPPPDAPPPRQWPFADALHPAIADMPASAEQSIDSVAAYLREREPDPYLLAKALHDYAADRIAYDVPSYRAGNIPPQNAEKIFAEKKGVCAGYAKLLVALGKAAGVELVYVVGQSRDMGGNVDGQGHAWNAVRIERKWYLVDATWDAGYVNGDTFTKQYKSDYLLTPPEIFGLNHYPEESGWQLREAPISRGDFMRQPNVRPSLYAEGFTLLDPLRSQVTVDAAFDVSLRNERDKWLLVSWSEKGSDQRERCEVTQGAVTSGHCNLPASGTYHVTLAVGQEQYGTYWHVGQFEVNRR